jgi:Holliday junction resolvasome RuvABC endonuclease subunit
MAVVHAGQDKSLACLYGGCITTERAKERQSVAVDDCQRIADITRWICTIYDEWEPEVVVLETPMSGARSAMAIKGMAFSTAMCMATAVAHFRCEILQLISPYDSKKWLTGNSHAEKDQMIKVVSGHFPDVVWPKMRKKQGIDLTRAEAIADALAAALTYLRTR